MRQIAEFDAPGPEQFRSEIAPLAQPAVLRGVAAEWPLVRAAKESADRWMAMLSFRASGQTVGIIRTDPENEGRFHYTPDGRGLNFARGQANLPGVLVALQEQAASDRPYALAAQGMIAESVLPGFAQSHPMPYVPDSAVPRFWIGNRAKVATHSDPLENLGVVVAGRRRFTLFPPDQIGNLYLGPLHFTPAGVPISMVHVTAPDLDTYPRFAEALDAATVAELEPGDALFIPYGWYHHVESLEPFNMWVNYWWNEAREDIGSAWDAMLHGMLSLRTLPPHQRAAWKAMFDHYVFQLDRDPAEHLGAEVAGVLGPVTPEAAAAMRQALIEALTKEAERAGGRNEPREG
jgi:hypothetical protein